MNKEELLFLMLTCLIFSSLSPLNVYGQQFGELVKVPKESLDVYLAAVKGNTYWRNNWYYDPSNKVMQIPTMLGKMPSPQATGLAGHLYALSIIHATELSLSGSNLQEVKNRLRQISSYFLTNSRGGLWASEITQTYVDVAFSSMVVWFESEAYMVNVINKSDVQMHVQSLSALQTSSGGWFASTAPYSQWKQPLVTYTSLALTALLKAETAGLSVDKSVINKAINYLQSKAVKGVGTAHWARENMPVPTVFADSTSPSEVITSLALYALSTAKMQGYNVDTQLLQNAAHYLLDKFPAQTNKDDKLLSSMALAAAAGAGAVDISTLVGKTFSFLYGVAENFDVAKPPFPWEAIPTYCIYFWEYIETVTVENSITTAVAPAKAVLTEKEVTKVVRGATVEVNFQISNMGASQLKLFLEPYTSASFKINSSSSNQVTLESGSQTSYKFSFKIPEAATPGELKIGVKVYKLVEGKKIPSRWSKETSIVIIKNAQLTLTRKVTAKSLNLGDNLTITLQIKNTGDVEASNIVIREDLNEGFEISSYLSSDQAMFTSTGLNLVSIKPQEEKVYTYSVVAEKANAGNQTLSTTTLTYLDVFNKPHTITQKTDVIVHRPKITLKGSLKVGEEESQKEIEAPWGSKVKLTITLKNEGNLEAKNIELNAVIPKQLQIISDETEGAISKDTVVIELENLKPNEQKSFKITTKTANFYMSLKQKAPIFLDLKYTDLNGRFVEGAYKSSTDFQVNITVPMWLEISVAASIIALILLVSALLIRKARKEKRRKVYSPKHLIMKERRKKRSERLG